MSRGMQVRVLFWALRTLLDEILQHKIAGVSVPGSRIVFRSFFVVLIAEIAQLVEHNLAKVRVASSSLVFRSSEKSVLRLVSLFLCL